MRHFEPLPAQTVTAISLTTTVRVTARPPHAATIPSRLRQLVDFLFRRRQQVLAGNAERDGEVGRNID